MVHFVLIPVMAPGHALPMAEIGRLLAARGGDMTTTIITTPLNAARIKPTLAGTDVHVEEIPFPTAEANLPDGCETLDAIPSADLVLNFFGAVSMLRSPVEACLRALRPPPDCIVSDMGLPWTGTIATAMGIPRVIFHGTCCFSILCSTNMRAPGFLDGVASDTEFFPVQGIRPRVEVTKAQLPANFSPKAASGMVREIREAEAAAFGVVLNSFDGLEEEYIESYRKVSGKKVWAVGPVAYGKEKRADGDHVDTTCLRWLDSFGARSVVYVGFGTLAKLTAAQVKEIALGLEASESPFMWALREASEETEAWLAAEGFEERNMGRCLIVRGWAPQVTILSHPSVGGFLTHCGWNSALEGVTAGVPMATWPFFAEQFLNERLLVDVLGTCVSVGVKTPTKWLPNEEEEEEASRGVVVGREEVEVAVRRLMGRDRGEGEERRRRASELGKKAENAVEEGVGSSYLNLSLMIQAVIDRK